MKTDYDFCGGDEVESKQISVTTIRDNFVMKMEVSMTYAVMSTLNIL